ncbi:hypothetical protein SPICUR_08530 [Spiribacter curvatus]|uniref:DhaL domain-containing protein n=1 Tax=Spiribacter curvatus TaxID=1335757 RepID=U5T558_9GAMM|nr:dihydroxyacetone kinase subunit DhaL [Spiribacter curvatus]AGY92634.1 hypothetical protein SPICUR_08530 [Spiribacter curvatus]
MAELDSDFIARFFCEAAARLEEQRDELCQLDGLVGDGDHGTSMANGFAALAALVRGGSSHTKIPGALLREAADEFLSHVGATVGPLYATGLLDTSEAMGEGAPWELNEFPRLMACLTQGIARRGKAAEGDKTMLDAWLPATPAAEASLARGASAAEAALCAREAAAEGARATASMIASRGRAARLKERSIGYQDPGAVSASIVIEALVETIEATPEAR